MSDQNSKGPAPVTVYNKKKEKTERNVRKLANLKSPKAKNFNVKRGSVTKETNCTCPTKRSKSRSKTSQLKNCSSVISSSQTPLINQVIQTRNQNRCNRHDNCFSRHRDHSESSSFVKLDNEKVCKLNKKIKELEKELTLKEKEIKEL